MPDIIALENARQAAYRAARADYDAAVETAKAEHAADRQSLFDLWQHAIAPEDAPEDAPGREIENQARAAFDHFPLSPDLRPLRDQLGASIEAADREFNNAAHGLTPEG